MRITFDNDIFAIQQYGGISRYYVELLAKISEDNFHNAQAGVLHGFHRNHYLKNIDLNLKSKPAYLRNFKGAGFALTRLNWYFNAIVSAPKTDIYHATYYRFPKRLSPSITKIITVYDMIHELYPNYFCAGDSTVSLKAKAINSADHIFSISQNTKQDLMDIYQVPESKITVTYLGVDHLKVRKQQMHKRENFLLYVGPRGGYKNFNGLLATFSKLLTTRNNLDLIAFGGGHFNDGEKALINDLNIPFERIKQISGPDEVLSGLYSRALVFVYPSFYEGFGIPPLEAMAKGCPVVASKTSSIGEVLGTGALLCDPHNVSDMVNKVGAMISNTEYRNSFVQKGYQQIKRYTWEQTTNLTLQTYSRFLQ